jgi:hypothetical protein
VAVAPVLLQTSVLSYHTSRKNVAATPVLLQTPVLSYHTSRKNVAAIHVLLQTSVLSYHTSRRHKTGDHICTIPSLRNGNSPVSCCNCSTIRTCLVARRTTNSNFPDFLYKQLALITVLFIPTGTGGIESISYTFFRDYDHIH